MISTSSVTISDAPLTSSTAPTYVRCSSFPILLPENSRTFQISLEPHPSQVCYVVETPTKTVTQSEFDKIIETTLIIAFLPVRATEKNCERRVSGRQQQSGTTISSARATLSSTFYSFSLSTFQLSFTQSGNSLSNSSDIIQSLRYCFLRNTPSSAERDWMFTSSNHFER